MLKSKGFSLLEVILAVAIILIILAILFVSFDPLANFRASRDAQRWSDVSNLVQAIKLHQAQNDGNYIQEIDKLKAGQVYMIGSDKQDCDAVDGDNNAIICDVPVTQSQCVDLLSLQNDLLKQGYVEKDIISPGTAYNSWDQGKTGYTIEIDEQGTIHARACLSEGETLIEISK